MKFINKNILLISPEPWDHIFVSKHHYAIHLANRGNRVVFLNPPSQSSNEPSIQNTAYKNLRVCDYNGFWLGLRFYPKVFRKRNVKKIFKKIEELVEIPFDVIWSFDNSVFFDFDALSTKLIKISHIVDLNQDFQTKLAATSADICFGVTSSIIKRLKVFNSNSYFINHGLNVKENKNPVLDVPGNNKIKAIYLGNLAMQYLDWEPIYNVVHKHDDVDFIFIGPNKDLLSTKINPTHSYKKMVLGYENAYFLKPIESGDIQSYLKAADVLMLCYQERFHHFQSNSHKILEYLYSERPIVSSFCEEYDGKELLYMDRKNSKWSSVFEYVVSHLDGCSHRELADKRKNYALDNTYDKQIDRIEKYLDQ